MPGDRQSPTERLRLAERRRQAFYLHAVRNLTAAEIAELLQVSPRTVERDLQAARRRGMKELQRRAETAESITDLALDIDASLSAIAREAWTSVAASDALSPQHIRALNTVLAATTQRAAVLQSLGLLKQIPTEFSLLFDPLALTDEEVHDALTELEDPQEPARETVPEG